MYILQKYVSREFCRVLILSMMAFIAIFLVVDIFQGIRMILQFKPSIFLVARFYLLKIPSIISQVMPVSILLSTLISIGILSKNSEITAMKSGGISLYRIIMPVLSISLLIGLILFLSNEYIVPHANRESKITERVHIKKKARKSFFRQNKIWYRSENAVYNIKYFNPDSNIMKGITIYYIKEGFRLERRLDAEEARWDGKQWLFHHVVINNFINGMLESTSHDDLPVRMPETPETFKKDELGAEEMGFAELRDYIKNLRAGGIDTSRLSVDLYGKMASPFNCLVMALLGIPFALKGGRSGGIAVGIGLSVFISFGFWLVMSLGMSLGRAGAFPPLIAAWGANIIFSLTGMLLMMNVEGD